jgi:phosphate-selective porin OprO and OprP
MKLTHWLAVAALVSTPFQITLIAQTADSSANATNQNIQVLIQRINELEEKVKVLERNREVDKETDQEKAKVTPTVSLGATGLTVSSADSNFVMIAHGYAQADARFYLGDKTTPDTFLLRRVRPIVEGTVWGNFDYRLMLDLGSGNVNSSTAFNNAILDDAYVNARPFKQFQIQVGKYKSPIGLERLESAADLNLIETGFATELTPNYDLGASIHNGYFTNPLGYSIGIYNGATDGGSSDQDNDEGKDVVGRLFAQPFINCDSNPLRKLGFGAGGSVGDHIGTLLPTYKTSGQQTFFSYATNVTANGEQWRIDPQAYYYVGPFGLLGEYVVSSQEVKSSIAHPPTNERFNNRAWQVEASYFLTCEENYFKYTSLEHVVPLHRIGTDGGWGAFEVVARIQQMNLDDAIFADKFATSTSARQATAWAAGLNWYLNSNVKLNLNYEHTTFEGGSAAANSPTAKPEHVILSRVQFQF